MLKPPTLEGGGVASKLQILEKGVVKGEATQLNFETATISVNNDVARIAEAVSGSGGADSSRAITAVAFNGQVTTPNAIILNSVNVTKVVRLDGGLYEVHFKTPLPSTNYFALCSFTRDDNMGRGGYGMTINLPIRDRNKIVVDCQFVNGSGYDFAYVCVVVFQA